MFPPSNRNRVNGLQIRSLVPAFGMLFAIIIVITLALEIYPPN